MAGIALVLDLLKKSQSFNSKHSLHSSAFSSAAAASAAAVSVAASAPFASRFLFGSFNAPVAYCDAAAAIGDDYLASLRRLSADVLQHDSIRYTTTKEYKVEPKPLFSAFEFRALAMTTLRSFLLFYLPLLEPKTEAEDDDDFLRDPPEQRSVDLVVPFKNSVKQIARETTVVTIRRLLERLALHYVSQRMAWKLLKDVPKSTLRKAERGLLTHVYIFRVSRTTLRGHCLGVAAAWIVQVGIETYRCLSPCIRRVRPNKDENPEEEEDQVEVTEQAKVLGKKIAGITVRCGASLVFAAIGAGICACIIRPSTGQWIGCALGDLAGPVIVTMFFETTRRSDL
ncbi:PREDICTED: uncharacterized protein LOC104817703 [Tarenaya hassleriana]|uniref:uncharacterized protein LOC104817703 n=1 Tax=Tarenaya hassleriana TaxID=28532 RepID=UPI00053C4ECD|nr:PREDICTED: uncharacterized protein LOC104817703 [Tarenaya hassleriana]